MSNVNLDLQLKFLDQLEDALAEAMQRYADKGESKLSELAYMQREVDRARRIVASRQVDQKPAPRRYEKEEQYSEARL